MSRMDDDRIETIITLEVPEGYAEGGRLDLYITRFLPNVSRSKVQRGISEGMVKVNEVVVTKPSYAVQPGDIIACAIMRPQPIEAAPEDIPLEIVYEDSHLIVVNKPAGMVVHPAYGNRTGTLVNALLHHVGAGVIKIDREDEDDVDDDPEDELGLSTVNAAPARKGDASIRPGIIHRLDKNTSGLLVVAKNDVVHRALARQFADHTIERRYLAILWGAPEPEVGTIRTYLGRDPRDRKKMAVVPSERGKLAITHYGLLERHPHTSIVAFHLETGRTHQIRVHARHINHPVVGDQSYGGTALRHGPNTSNRRAFFRNLFEMLSRQALHAETLGFTHPTTGEAVSFQVDPPEDMLEAIRRLRSFARE